MIEFAVPVSGFPLAFDREQTRISVAELASKGVMRHRDRRLTDKIYTDENLLGTWAAFDSLKNYTDRASQIALQILGAGGQIVTSPVAVNAEDKAQKTIANIGESRVLTLADVMGQVNENGGSGGARTRNKSNDSLAKTDSPSQIASQKSVALGHDLSQVVTAWAKLPAALKAAILAIVKSAE